jgi:hypothetical protein
MWLGGPICGVNEKTLPREELAARPPARPPARSSYLVGLPSPQQDFFVFFPIDYCTLATAPATYGRYHIFMTKGHAAFGTKWLFLWDKMKLDSIWNKRQNCWAKMAMLLPELSFARAHSPGAPLPGAHTLLPQNASKFTFKFNFQKEIRTKKWGSCPMCNVQLCHLATSQSRLL